MSAVSTSVSLMKMSSSLWKQARFLSSLNGATKSDSTITSVFVCRPACTSQKGPPGAWCRKESWQRLLRHKGIKGEFAVSLPSSYTLRILCHSLGSDRCNENMTKLLPSCQILAQDTERVFYPGGHRLVQPLTEAWHHAPFMDRDGCSDCPLQW